jgi:hypothetical protein
MHTQLNRKPANLTNSLSTPQHGEISEHVYLKNATRDIDLSSWGVREDVNMERNTAGVTGNRLDGLGGGGCRGG